MPIVGGKFRPWFDKQCINMYKTNAINIRQRRRLKMWTISSRQAIVLAWFGDVKGIAVQIKSFIYIYFFAFILWLDCYSACLLRPSSRKEYCNVLI